MKYIPGSAKYTIEKECREGLKNQFEVIVECDANDGDYISRTMYYDSLDELRVLLLNYLSRYKGKWYSSWNGTHYGNHVVNNDILKDWLCREEWLLYAGMIDNYCHSISDISVCYYDKEGNIHAVSFPNVDDLFDSEEEFLEYIHGLIEKDNDSN